MAKRQSKEEVMIEYFETADIAKVEVVFNIAKGIMKRRSVAPAKASTPKGARKAKVAVAAAPAASASTETPDELEALAAKN